MFQVENINILDMKNVDVQILKSLPPNSFVVDVRPEVEFSMYHLPDTVNIPYSEILKGSGVDDLRKEICKREGEQTSNFCLNFVCVC